MAGLVKHTKLQSLRSAATSCYLYLHSDLLTYVPSGFIPGRWQAPYHLSIIQCARRNPGQDKTGADAILGCNVRTFGVDNLSHYYDRFNRLRPALGLPPDPLPIAHSAPPTFPSRCPPLSNRPFHARGFLPTYRKMSLLRFAVCMRNNFFTGWKSLRIMMITWHQYKQDNYKRLNIVLCNTIYVRIYSAAVIYVRGRIPVEN